MIDTHCHLAFPALSSGVEAVVADARAAGVDGMITISTTSQDASANLDLARRFDCVWCSAGVHPLHADEPRDWEEIRRVARDPKCVAWGELGLDHHYNDPPRSVQNQILEEQLQFIAECERDGTIKPIIVHCRDSLDDLIRVFRRAPFDPTRYVFHCFTSDAGGARKVLDFGAWISFTGVVTFQNAPEVREAAKIVPHDRIMVETDAPYLSPEPVRNVRPCEPKFVVHTARFLAQLRGVDPVEFEAQLDRNAERFFGITLDRS